MRFLTPQTLGTRATVELNPQNSDSGPGTGHHARLRKPVEEVVGRSQVLVLVVWPYWAIRSDFGPRDFEGYRAGTRSRCTVQLRSVPTPRTSGNGSGSPPSPYPRGLVRRASDTWPGCRASANPSVSSRLRPQSRLRLTQECVAGLFQVHPPIGQLPSEGHQEARSDHPPE